MKIQNNFYLNCLWKASTNPLIGQINKPESNVIICYDKKKLKVEDIYDTRFLEEKFNTEWNRQA